MVFPQTYTQVSTMLVDDTIIIVKARADRSDDEGVRVIALEVSAPDTSEAISGPVRLSMAAARCIPPLVERLKEVLAAHPGTTEVHLHLTGGANTTVLRLDDGLRVTPSPSLYGDLKALLGPSCLS
jgi:DNA polymerase-3 subunit alpha